MPAASCTYRARIVLDLGEELREVWRELGHRSSRSPWKSFSFLFFLSLFFPSEKVEAHFIFFFCFAGKKLSFLIQLLVSPGVRRLTMPQYIPREDDDDVIVSRAMVRTAS